MEKKIVQINILILLILFIAIVAFPIDVRAATLSIEPQSGSYRVGSLISVTMYVSSSDQAMNAITSTILFPKDRLEVTSILKEGSIVNLWIREPSFSNITGQISLEGVVLNPGFTGAKGKLLTIIFRTKVSGDAAIRVIAASVLANDGSGTNILSGFGNVPLLTIFDNPEMTVPASSTQVPFVGQDIIKNEPATTPVVVATQQTIPFQIILSVMDIFALLLSISALFILLVLVWVHGLHKIKNVRKKLKDEAGAATTVFEKTYWTLKVGVQEYIKLLNDKSGKTEHDLEIEKTLHNLEQQLDQAEQSVQKEMRTIEKNSE